MGEMVMNIFGFRSIGFAILLLLIAEASCDRPKRTSSTSNATSSLDGRHAPITAHTPDAFYDPPPNLPQHPGVLLRSEPLKDVILRAGTRGWRILYTTSVDDNTPATAVATVFAPTDPLAGPRPVIAWEHGTTGLLQKCMPSLFSTPSAGIPARERISMAGWVVIETDYSFAEKGGPHPYLIGEGEARATLDSVRAARQMPELTLDKRIVVWGYSQGGHAALWTGIVGPRYAPELEIIGIAAIAPPTDLRKNLEMSVEVNKLFGPYLAAAYSRFYPDIKFEQAVRPEALDTAREMINLCDSLPAEESKRIEALAGSLDGPSLATNSSKALQARLEQNSPDGSIQAPVVIAQGSEDNVVPASVTDAYVKRRCSAGQRLEYWTFMGRDHFSIAQLGSPLEEKLVSWTKARFANESRPDDCVFLTVAITR
jgi:pimeloyl-ACP methyl ester carboxylesterase